VGESAPEIVSQLPVPPAPSPRRTRLMDGIIKPKIFKDGNVHYANLAASTQPCPILNRH
jgi:hypothetical protein